MAQIVNYCKNPAITEAWAVIQGLPAPHDDVEINAVIHATQKSIPALKRMPSIVVIQKQEGPVPAFWHSQYSWGADRYRTRIGHQYLSIHYIQQQEQKYETYQKSLEPEVKRLLKIWKSTASTTNSSRPLDRLGFGYINTFTFPNSKFDLSEYFKMNLNFTIEIEHTDLIGMKTDFNLIDQETNTHLILELSIEEDPANKDTIRLITKVNAEKVGIQHIPLNDVERIMATTLEVKTAAKTAFFGFATPSTHQIMGAEYAST